MQVVKSAIAKAIIVEIKVLNFMMVLVEGGVIWGLCAVSYRWTERLCR